MCTSAHLIFCREQGHDIVKSMLTEKTITIVIITIKMLNINSNTNINYNDCDII